MNEIELRGGLSENLAKGRFRLIVAVDAITPELKLIIEYLNEHTIAEVQVLALELAYGQDGDLEFLIPIVYGLEGAERKVRNPGTGVKWNADSFSEQIAARTRRLVSFSEPLPGQPEEARTKAGRSHFRDLGASPTIL